MQQQKNQISLMSNTAFKGSDILQSFMKLHFLIDDLDVKMENVVEKHQAQFLLAYRNQIKIIKSQLKQLKDKSDQQEKRLVESDRAYLLEKQITIFRQEALKLFDKLEAKTQENQLFKAKVKELEKSSIVSQIEHKQLIKHAKTLEAKLYLSDKRIAQLQQQLKEKDQAILELSQKMNSIHKNQHTKSYQLSGRTHNKTINYLKGSNSQTKSSKIHDSELKQWFLQCIRSIKKDVAFRKNMGNQLNFNTISSIEEFKMVDKLKLLEKFMENQKLLTWLYEKIFPSRINEVKEYLSHRSFQFPQHIDNNSQIFQAFGERGDERVEITLPKMMEKKNKSKARSRINMKQGKLHIGNISSF